MPIPEFPGVLPHLWETVCHEGLRSALMGVEREVIGHALSATGGNKSATARLLRISRVALYGKIDRYGLHQIIDEFKPSCIHHSDLAR